MNISINLKSASGQVFHEWIEEIQALCQPDRIHYCDGSVKEYEHLCQVLVQKGLFVPLSKRPGSYWCHTHPDDVARVEEDTFICSISKEEAGPTNNWRDPHEMKSHLLKLFKGCMRGRTMYVIAFCMGPPNSPYSRRGVQITDSEYVAVSMQIMTRVSKEYVKEPFVPCLHSVGAALLPGQNDMSWPCNPKERIIAHFPEEPSIWSFGSGYGGNALLSKKCFALRIASAMGRKEKWLAEHMLIMGVENPEGEKRYFAAAFPSACGKTNLAMLKSSLPGWKVTFVGDDIAWMYFGQDGRLYAINPEYGLFGVAPGTSMSTNPYAMQTISKNSIFTNVALTPEGDVWWEGMTSHVPEKLTDWEGNPWVQSSSAPASHPNARFTAPINQSPILDSAWNDPNGVPISAIIFGGRRASLIPLVMEAKNWTHGVLLGAGLSSERTSAAKGQVGALRHDPFAMLPFCGYNMGDYFAHWLETGKMASAEKLPRIFQVNWFRKNAEGKYLWPGFGENIRVLKWIFQRVSDQVKAIETPVGFIPQELDVKGLELEPSTLQALLSIDRKGYKQELDGLLGYFKLYENKMPSELIQLIHESINAL